MDQGHKQTDEMLKDLEKRIQKVYGQAARETQQKVNKFYSGYADRYNQKVADLNDGKITKAEFQAWCRTNILTGKRWQELQDTLAQDMANADKLAMSMVNGHLPEVYALNHNYGTYEAEKGAMVSTSYTLYDRQTVERLIRDDPKLLPQPKINRAKDVRWNRHKFNEGITQGILQGESLRDIAKRVAIGTSSSDYKAAIRNARTATTGAENAGRIASYERAEKMGINVKKVWMSTIDNRTRDSHALLDGAEAEYDKPFANGLMFPGDPDGNDPAEIWNCRCTLIADVDGTPGYDMSDMTWRDNRLEGQTYDEWKAAHEAQQEEQEQPDIPRNVNGETIEFDLPPAKNERLQKMRDQQVEVIKDLSNEYNTRLQKVTTGAENAAGDVDITGSRLRLSSNKIEVAVHEFAHTLANTTADKYGLTNDKGFWDEIRKIRTAYRKDVRNDRSKSISFYADGQGILDEFMAEAFTQAKMTERGMKLPEEQYGTDTEYAERVLNVINKYFKKKR